MAQIDVATALQMICDMWRSGGSGTTITTTAAKPYFKNAVFLVEALDFPRGNVFTLATDDITFTTTPSNASYLLYILKSLDLLQSAYMSGEVLDSQFISWKSGMDAISQEAAGNLRGKLSDNFSKKYSDALAMARAGSHTLNMADLYDDF